MIATSIIPKLNDSTLCQKPKYTCHEIVKPIEPYIALTNNKTITNPSEIASIIFEETTDKTSHFIIDAEVYDYFSVQSRKRRMKYRNRSEFIIEAVREKVQRMMKREVSA